MADESSGTVPILAANEIPRKKGWEWKMRPWKSAAPRPWEVRRAAALDDAEETTATGRIANSGIVPMTPGPGPGRRS